MCVTADLTEFQFSGAPRVRQKNFSIEPLEHRNIFPEISTYYIFGVHAWSESRGLSEVEQILCQSSSNDKKLIILRIVSDIYLNQALCKGI